MFVLTDYRSAAGAGPEEADACGWAVDSVPFNVFLNRGYRYSQVEPPATLVKEPRQA